MFFKEYSEFIEALYCIYFAKITKEEKIKYYEEIYKEYAKYNNKNVDFEEIYQDLCSGVVRTLEDSDLEFLKVYNGLLFSIQNFMNLKVKIHYLESSPYIEKIFVVKKFTCLQCGSKNKKDFFTYNSEFGEITYCKRCALFGRVDDFLPRFFINIPFKNLKIPRAPEVRLSSLQKYASDKIVANCEKKLSSLVWAVCGAGKTEIVYDLLYTSLKNNKRVCMAIPRKDVVKELSTRFYRDFENMKMNILHGDEKTLVESNFYIMTTHQLVKYYRYFDVLIIDEVDAFPYYGDECLEQGARSALKKDGSLVFLSATPSEKIKKLVDDVIKIPIRYHRHLLPVPKVKIEAKKIFIFEKKSTLLREFLLSSFANNRRVLVFVPAITMCESVKKYIQSLINYDEIDIVHSKDKKRSEKIENFTKWKKKILITTTILERGVTFDYLDIVVFDARHSHFTKEALIQISGRVGRKDYDYKGEILFLADKFTEEMENAIKEIRYMNDLARFKKLNVKNKE